MRARILVFAAIVAVALALNLARLSLSIGQTGEDTVRARLAMASTALRGQLDLLDARLAPRAVATVPDLVEATRSEAGQAAAKPDEKALRAAASGISPEPDLLAVATPQGAILSRRGKPASTLDNINQIPLAKAALEANPAPAFATFEGATYRVAAARVPGNTAAAILGTVIDDRFAQQMKSQVDADVTLIQAGKVIASSLPGDERNKVAKWAAAPGPGYGELRVVLPLVGTDLSGKLPRGTSRFAVRGALVPAEGGVQVALTVPASPYTAWLARYQAFYLAGFALFILFSLVWALLARPKKQPVAPPQPAAAPPPPPAPEEEVSEPRVVSRAARAAPAPESLDPELPPPETAVPSVRAENEPREESWGTEPTTASSPADSAWEAPPAAPAAESSWGAAAESNEGAWPETPPAEDDHPWGEAPPPGGNGAQSSAPDLSEGPTGGVSPVESPEPAGFPGEAAPSAAAEEAPRPPEETTAPLAADFGMPAAEEQDPDEPHWRETFDRFKELKARLGEPADRISFEKFAAKLKKNRADLLAKHNCKGVRFSVYEKEGKAAIKASAIR